MSVLARETLLRSAAPAALIVAFAALIAACGSTPSPKQTGERDAPRSSASPAVTATPAVSPSPAACAVDSGSTRAVPVAALRALRRYVRLVDRGRYAAAAVSAAAGTPAADPRPLRRIENLRLLSVAGRY